MAPAKLLLAIAWLDQAELSACRTFNRTVRRAGLLRVFRIASRLGDGVLWYSLMALLALVGGAQGRMTALQCAVAGVTGLALYRGLKNVLVRERPYMTHAAIVCAGRPLDRFSFPSPAGFPLTNSLSVPPPSFEPSGVNSVFRITFPSGSDSVPLMVTSATSKNV